MQTFRNTIITKYEQFATVFIELYVDFYSYALFISHKGKSFFTLLETGSPLSFIEEVPYIKAVEFLMAVTSLKISSALVPMSINLFP